MVPGIFPSQLVILSTGQTYFETNFYSYVLGHKAECEGAVQDQMLGMYIVLSIVAVHSAIHFTRFVEMCMHVW